MTLTLMKGHKELMLQARFTWQRSSTIYWLLTMLGTPKMKVSSSLHSSQRRVPIRPWCNGLKTIWCHSLSSIVNAIVVDIMIQSKLTSRTTPCPCTLHFISPHGPIQSSIFLLPSILNQDFKMLSIVYTPHPMDHTKLP